MAVQMDTESACTYLLTFLASADGSYHPAELDAIYEQIARLWPDYHDPAVRVNEMIELIRKQTDEANEALMVDQLRTLSTLSESDRKVIFACLFDILNADGRVHPQETRLLKKIREHLIT